MITKEQVRRARRMLRDDRFVYGKVLPSDCATTRVFDVRWGPHCGYARILRNDMMRWYACYNLYDEKGAELQGHP